MVSSAGTPLPWRESDGNTVCASMNTQGAGTHPLQKAVLLVKRAPEKEDKHIAWSLGVNTRKVKGQLQLN